MKATTLIILSLCFLTAYGQSRRDSISIDIKLLSCVLDSKNESFNLTYAITNLSNETQYLWFNTNGIVDNRDLIKEFFLSKNDEGSCFYQIALETEATFKHELFGSFIKKLDSGKSFNIEFVSQEKIPEERIAEIVTFLDQTIVVMSESTITKEIKGFQSFNPHVFYTGSSLPLFVSDFLEVIGRIKTERTDEDEIL